MDRETLPRQQGAPLARRSRPSSASISSRDVCHGHRSYLLEGRVQRSLVGDLLGGQRTLQDAAEVQHVLGEGDRFILEVAIEGQNSYCRASSQIGFRSASVSPEPGMN